MAVNNRTTLQLACLVIPDRAETFVNQLKKINGNLANGTECFHVAGQPGMYDIDKTKVQLFSNDAGIDPGDTSFTTFGRYNRA